MLRRARSDAPYPARHDCFPGDKTRPSSPFIFLASTLNFPLFADSALAGPSKFDKMAQFSDLRQLGFDSLQGTGHAQAFAEENLISLLQSGLDLFGDAIAFQADLVNGARLRRIAIGEHIGRNVLDD